MLKHFYGLDPISTCDDPAEELVKIVSLHAVADKYDVPQLKILMADRFKVVGEQHWEALWVSNKISPIIEAVFNTTPSPLESIRVTTVELTFTHISKLQGNSADKLRTILEENPDFSTDLVLRLMKAQEQANAKITDLLANGPPHLTELHCCAERGETERCRAILEKGVVAVDVPDEDGETPLHFAVYFGFLDTTQLLVNNGANINAMGHTYQSTPLRWARHANRADIEAYLVGLGAEDRGQRA
jgi:hypothetical protein